MTEEMTRRMYALAEQGGALEFMLSARMSMGWETVARDERMGEFMRSRSAFSVKNEWAAEAAKRVSVRINEDPHGMNFIARAYVLSEEELNGLLLHAYNRGFFDASQGGSAWKKQIEPQTTRVEYPCPPC